VHGGAWRPGLAVWLTDPAPLRAVADADARLGLGRAALEALQVVATAEGDHLLDDRATVLAVAGLYRANGQLPEALDALDFLARRAPDPVLDARARVLRARILAQQGDRDGARALYASVTSPPDAAAEANIRLALDDAESGVCDPDRLALAAAAAPLPADLPGGVVALARSRCLGAAGRADEARAAAMDAAAGLHDPAAVALATWIGGAPSPAGATDVWSRLHAADASYATLRDRVDAEKASGFPPADR
jgi:tetratricopeptide (TPR) repeat protein